MILADNLPLTAANKLMHLQIIRFLIAVSTVESGKFFEPEFKET